MRCAGEGIRTSSSISIARALAACGDIVVWARIASTICWPMVWTGLSEVIGSWKIIDILPPRSLRRSSADSVSRSRPSNMHRLGLDLARRARHQAHDRERRHALAAAGFADQADGAAARRR